MHTVKIEGLFLPNLGYLTHKCNPQSEPKPSKVPEAKPFTLQVQL